MSSAGHVKNSGAKSTSQSIGSMFVKKAADHGLKAGQSKEVKCLTLDGGDAEAPTIPDVSGIVPSAVPIPVDSGSKSSDGNRMSNFFSSSAVTDSEIIWALKVVMNHLSLNSCKDLGRTLQRMFPDSAIARKFTLSPAKVAYTIVHGLAPYFSDNLLQALQECTYFVACFDEALNKVAQRGQMDIIIRFWDNSCDKVATRYFKSVFLGHATAKDLEEKFVEGLAGLNLKKLVQISMDGPSVNWKFLETFAWRRSYYLQLICFF
jgi:hypothetical protein